MHRSSSMFAVMDPADKCCCGLSFCFICNLLPRGHVLHCPGWPPHQKMLQIHSDSSLAEHINEGLQCNTTGQASIYNISMTSNTHFVLLSLHMESCKIAVTCHNDNILVFDTNACLLQTMLGKLLRCCQCSYDSAPATECHACNKAY